MSELTQLDSVKSMMRYLPPNGTAASERKRRQHAQRRAFAAGQNHGSSDMCHLIS